MKIIDISAELKPLKLIKPYRIANQTIDSVTNCIVKLKLENGVLGLGAGAPIDFVTGETHEKCLDALNPANLSWLIHQSIYSWPAQVKSIQHKLKYTPAAAAALDMALYDAYGKVAKQPLVDILGRVHQSLPTSITIGIKSIEASILEAASYVDKGFKHLKIKLGENLEKDIEMVHALMSNLPKDVHLRVDMNEGYSPNDLNAFVKQTTDLDIELIEQPFAKAVMPTLAQFPINLREKIAADESLINVENGFQLVHPEKLCGIFNIKLMKCGGISPALSIAKLAEYAHVDLMWGCMDESIISISAALHVALACSKTKYLDLDGSFDLVEDLVEGGFILEEGRLRTNDQPGLGVGSL